MHPLNSIQKTDGGFNNKKGTVPCIFKLPALTAFVKLSVMDMSGALSNNKILSPACLCLPSLIHMHEAGGLCVLYLVLCIPQQTE